MYVDHRKSTVTVHGIKLKTNKIALHNIICNVVTTINIDLFLNIVLVYLILQIVSKCTL